jgi:hypothetical protein
MIGTSAESGVTRQPPPADICASDFALLYYQIVILTILMTHLTQRLMNDQSGNVVHNSKFSQGLRKMS